MSTDSSGLVIFEAPTVDAPALAETLDGWGADISASYETGWDDLSVVEAHFAGLYSVFNAVRHAASRGFHFKADYLSEVDGLVVGFAVADECTSFVFMDDGLNIIEGYDELLYAFGMGEVDFATDLVQLYKGLLPLARKPRKEKHVNGED